MKNVTDKLIALAEKWRKEIADYDKAHIDSSDPEDWVGPIRTCLSEVDTILIEGAETPIERIARRKAANYHIG